MKITRDKKRWILAVILLFMVCGVIWGKPDLWYRQSDNGHEINFSENTYAIVASEGDIIQQSFVAEVAKLESVSMLMVAWDEADTNSPVIILSEEDGDNLIESKLELDAESRMMKSDINLYF